MSIEQLIINLINFIIAEMVKLVYTQDLKSYGRKIVRVGSTPTLGTENFIEISSVNTFCALKILVEVNSWFNVYPERSAKDTVLAP